MAAYFYALNGFVTVERFLFVTSVGPVSIAVYVFLEDADDIDVKK